MGGYTHVLPLDVTRLEKVVQLAAELGAGIFVDLPVVLGQPVLLHAEPVGLPSARLGDQIDREAGGAEDLEWVQCFRDEEPFSCISTCGLAIQGHCS